MRTKETKGEKKWETPRVDQIQSRCNMWREGRFEKKKYHTKCDIRVRLRHPLLNCHQLRISSFPLRVIPGAHVVGVKDPECSHRFVVIHSSASLGALQVLEGEACSGETASTRDDRRHRQTRRFGRIRLMARSIHFPIYHIPREPLGM